LKSEFDIEDIWVPHELHPETPVQGQPMTERFNQFDIDQAAITCNQRGKPYGIVFGDMSLLSNSRLSLEAAEYAREQGAYHAFHNAVFKASFTDGKNIGDMDVLLDVGESCGLDRAELRVSLEEGSFAEQVAKGSEAARAAGVTALPTFIIEDLPPITGAVHEDTFRKVLQDAGGREKNFHENE